MSRPGVIEVAKFAILTRQIPDIYLSSFVDLDIDELSARAGVSIAGVGFDIDLTVVDHFDEFMPQKHLEKFAELGQRDDIEGFAGITNTGDDRERLERAQGFIQHIGEATGKPTILVASSDVGGRKPREAIFHEAPRRLNLLSRQMAMVGDQGAKDTLGARNSGYGATAQVAPYGTHPGDWRTHYFQRPMEAAVRLIMPRGIFRVTDFGKGNPRLAEPVDGRLNDIESIGATGSADG
ncbi:MAG: HAD hydrolase-like protein [Patescibacteria group bacterium]